MIDFQERMQIGRDQRKKVVEHTGSSSVRVYVTAAEMYGDMTEQEWIEQQQEEDEMAVKANGFDAAFSTFFEGCKRIHGEYRDRNGFTFKEDPWSFTEGGKRIRVVHGGGVFCFVDLGTGDVLKPASWNAPAKHARGNIFDDANGLRFIGPFGPAYLR